MFIKHAFIKNTHLHRSLDEENMDWLAHTNYHRAHCEALDTPNLVCVTPLGDIRLRALISIYIQRLRLELRSCICMYIYIYNNANKTIYRRNCSRTCTESTPGVVLINTWAWSRAEAVERDLLVAYSVIDIRGSRIVKAAVV